MYFSHALTATAVQPSALEARPTVDTLPTDRRPDSVDCQKLQQQIAALARSYPCMHGGGHHGHIYVICRNGTNDYHVLTNGAVAAIVPMHPGAPPQFAPGTTGVLMANGKTSMIITYSSSKPIKKLILSSKSCFLEPATRMWKLSATPTFSSTM